MLSSTGASPFTVKVEASNTWSFQNLIEVFERMRKTVQNSSILIISHQERILNIADEIVMIKDGRVEKQGTRDEILPQLMGTSSAVSECRMVNGKECAK